MVVAHPHPRLLSPQEAVNSATWFVRSRGLVVQETRYLRLDHFERWHVHLAGSGGRDRAQVILDGYSGRILSARLRGPGAQPLPQPPGTAPEEEAPPATPPGAAPKELPPPPPATPPPPPAK